MIRSDIRSLSAYNVPESGDLIKLDAMENPYPMPERLHRAWLRAMADVQLNRYPDAGAGELRGRIARRDGVEPGQVLLGNGSDEIIQMLLMAADAGACVVPQPTFTMYSLIARWLRRPVAGVPLAPESFALDASTFLGVCSREKAAITFLACPNNPTGNLWPKETVREIAANFRGIVVIDEAYLPFAERDHAELIAPNVVVLRTLSKLGLAGLRLGYALGDPGLIAQLNKVRLPYNVSQPTQATAAFMLDHFESFERQIGAIREERARLFAALEAIEGVQAYPSQTNFLLLRLTGRRGANEVHAALLGRGVLVKNLDGADALLHDCLRVTIGTPEENDRFIQALKEAIS